MRDPKQPMCFTVDYIETDRTKTGCTSRFFTLSRKSKEGFGAFLQSVRHWRRKEKGGNNDLQIIFSNLKDINIFIF